MRPEEAKINKLNHEIAKLEKRIEDCGRAYAVQEIELEMERRRGELLEERVDALRSLLPSYGSKVERWVHGNAVAL